MKTMMHYFPEFDIDVYKRDIESVYDHDKATSILKMIEEAGCPTATPVVLTSQNSFEIVSQGDVEINQPIIKLN